MRKFVSAVLVLAVLFSMICTPISAQTQESTYEDGQITPRYTYIGSITAGLTISTSGLATCSGTIVLGNSHPSTITVNLQQYVQGSWVTIESSSKSFTGNGTKKQLDQWYVYSGHSYRNLVEVEIFDSNGNCIEYESGASPTKLY